MRCEWRRYFTGPKGLGMDSCDREAVNIDERANLKLCEEHSAKQDAQIRRIVETVREQEKA